MAKIKRLSAEERKATIVAAAMGLFAERGFHGVPVGDIVKAAGVSPALLYQHFESKEALYNAVLNEFASQREDYIEAVPILDGSLEDILRAMLNVFIGNMSQHPDFLKMELHSLLDGSNVSQKFFTNRWKNLTDIVEYMVGEAENSQIKNIDGKIAGLMLQGMVREALIAKKLCSDDRFSNMEIEEMIEMQITLFLKILR